MQKNVAPEMRGAKHNIHEKYCFNARILQDCFTVS